MIIQISLISESEKSSIKATGAILIAAPFPAAYSPLLPTWLQCPPKSSSFKDFKVEAPTPAAEVKEPVAVATPASTPTARVQTSRPLYERQQTPVTPAPTAVSQPQMATTTPVNEPADDMFVDKNSDAYKAAQIACSIDNPDDCEMCGS